MDMLAKKRGNKKLNYEIADEIRKKYKEGNENMYALAKMYSVSPANICNIINRKTWMPADNTAPA